MKNLSVIVAGRNDGYGDNFLTPYNSYTPDTYCFRMKRTVEHNINLLSKRGVDIQYVIVDWCPLENRTLDQDTYIKQLLETFGDKIKHIVVHGEEVKRKGWNPKNFYEYYAKNVGIRNADGEYVIITNPDDLFSEELCDSIAKVLNQEGDSKKEYYRQYSRKDIDNGLNLLAEGLSFPKNGIFVDEVIGTPAAGDFLMSTKQVIVEYGQGFDESFTTDGNKQQTSLDGSILLNLYAAGVIPVCLNGSVLHLDHAKPHAKDFVGIKQYSNHMDWGMLAVELKNIN